MKEEHLTDALLYIPEHFKVISKADEFGMSDLVPMHLWPAQADYIEKRTHRDVILKGRQMGISTGVEAGNGHKLFTLPYQRMVIITHDDETSEFLLQNIHRFYNNLPEYNRPATDWASGRRMRFPILDSYIYIDSAKSDAIGIGHTLNIAHLSEVARWPEKKGRQLFADITQTVPMGGFVTVESTPKGRAGLFYDLYTAAKKGEVDFKPFFYPWYFDPNYRIPLNGHTFTASKEEQQLIDNFALVPEQIMFRRVKIAELGDLFYQEYPENDIDCWLSGEGFVFDGVAMRQYLQHTMPGREIGNTTIWKDVIGGEKYVMGVDVAAGIAKGDYSVASVLNVKRNEYVARVRGRIPPDLFAQECLDVAHRYNDCLVGIEKTGHGHMVLRVFMENDYQNLYYHLDYDSVMKVEMNDAGWRTTVKSKPIMVHTMAQAIRAEDLISYSENLMLEASGYMWDGDKPKPSGGGFDDELDAVMIALQLRENAPIEPVRKYETVQRYVRL